MQGKEKTMSRRGKSTPVLEVRPETREPCTALGRRLAALREKIVADGEPLLDWEGIDREVAERRGRVETGEE
jgi:hypothetical protein